MKTDVLTMAALVFIIGLLLSSISFSEIFDPSEDDAPTALQQGSAFR